MTYLSRAFSLSILAVALAACGSSGGDSPSTQAANNAKPQTPATTPAENQSAGNAPKEPKLTLTTMPDGSAKRIYELPYSTVTGITQTKRQANGYTEEVTDIQISGTPTLESALPKMGKVVYHGDAFNEQTDPVEGTIGYGTSPGSLEYTIDFDERTGHGKISALQLDFGDIMLRQGKLEKINLDGQEVMGVRSNVDVARSGNPDNPEYAPAGNYELGVFGPNADSIAGKLKNSAFDIGFGGTRDGK
ncbi:factor H binding protein domain-containing protein [Neisseria mucosa]|uniref:factor H binding protein domain-containing protein n=1 Tax=Neisseria mucosa TaxID=488 RepID=UPI0027E17C90|nr:factor H binding protein domain-containing protein [Neisseria mucosa]